MERLDLEQIIMDLIGLKQEGGYWDFKKEWHHLNADLLHDIICMANNLLNRDGYIIIGVDEKNDFKLVDVCGDENRKTTQNVVDFLRSKKFAGGIRPTVYVQTLIFARISVDVVVVKNDYYTPYYLAESYQGVFANNIYSRVMDTNTPKNASADINNIEYLWQKRFHLNASPLDRVKYYLGFPEDWLNSHSETSTIEFYKFSPEFTIEHTSAEDRRDGYEFYLFGQTDKRPHWYNITIKYHQTIIASIGGVALDGGRYFTSTPETNGFSFKSRSTWDISYKYFVKDSIKFVIHRYFLPDDCDEGLHSYERFIECILIFDSSRERLEFEQYVLTHQSEIADLSEKAWLPYFPQLPGYNMEAFIKEYQNSSALKSLFEDFKQKTSHSDK